jgi:peptidyl-Lys metalloendopeptidase
MQIKNQISSIRNALYAIILLTAFLLVFGGGNLPPVHAQENGAETPEGPVVNISADVDSFGMDEEVILHVTITNPTTDAINLLKWFTPIDGVTEPLFVVMLDGEPAPYVGALYKRAAPTEKDYYTLEAGESFNSDVTLSAYYDLSVSGNYTVMYNAASEDMYTNINGRLSKSAGSLTSNVLDLFIEGRTPPVPEEVEAQVVVGSNSFANCTSSRQTDAANARIAASTYANDAAAYFSANKQGERYAWWFGSYNASRYSTVTSHYNNVRNAVDNANPMTFDCACAAVDPADYPYVFAYVYPDQPYTINLCGAFWSAATTGTDSKAGTLIHEITHFTVVAGTTDYVYGQTGAHNLAVNTPAQAIMNADNHEYFAENNPPLETTPGYTISGNAGVGGATLTYTGGSTTADGSGLYSFTVSSGWTGTVTPSKTNYTFSPASKSYTNVLANQTAQDYTATATGTVNLLEDPSFELYYPNPYWASTSTNFNSPLCSVTDCGSGGTYGPRTGSVWSWFGWIGEAPAYELASLSQTVVIPSGTATLKFYLWVSGATGAGSDATDVFTAKVDDVTVFSAHANQMSSYPAYTLVSVDVSAYADNAAHTVMFSSETTGQYVSFNLDDVALLSGSSPTGYIISGNAGVGGATLTYTGGSTTANGSGLYSFSVSSGWSGTVTPSKTGYTFSPPSKSYTNV